MTDENQTRRHAAMFQAAAEKYGFPQPTVDELADEARGAAYFRALVAHVHKHDWSAAHELRVGRPQAEWTPADVESFDRFLLGKTRPAHELDPGVHVFQGVDLGDQFPVTEACLRELAHDSLEHLMDMRRRGPEKPLPILAVVLLTTGQAKLVMPPSDDRIAMLKTLARTQPVFGFALTFDCWKHHVERATADAPPKAGKVDAIVQHVMTRELRVVRQRTYRLEGARRKRVVFDDPPPPDMDPRDPTGPTLDDPYAEIFVTVPPVRGPQ